MANHHQGGNGRNHHPLWNLISSWQSILAVILIVMLLIGLVRPDLVGLALRNLGGAVAEALAPFVPLALTALIVVLGFRVMFHRPNRRGNGRH